MVKRSTTLRYSAIAFVTGLLVVIAGCDRLLGPDPIDSVIFGPGAGEESKAIVTDDGNLRVLITDAPFWFDEVDSAIVGIRRVDLVNAEGGVVIVWEAEGEGDEAVAEEINLIELQNGISEELVEAFVPVGDYKEIRVVVDEKGRVVMKDSTIYDLKVPSGSQTGIKIKLNNFQATTEDLSTIVLDIPLEESFVVKGNPTTPAGIKGFNFKPVVHLKKIVQEGIVDAEKKEWEGTATVVEENGEFYLTSGEAEPVRFLLTTETDFDGLEWLDLAGLVGQQIDVSVEYETLEDGTSVAREVKVAAQEGQEE